MIQINSSSASLPDYGAKVDPEPVKELARKILSRVNKRGVRKCWGAAALHQYVYENVEYDHTLGSGYNRPPAETVKKGGKCVDQSILLASLYKCIELDCCLTIVHVTGENYHMFPEVFFPIRRIDVLTDSLQEYYAVKHDREIRKFDHRKDQKKGGYWFITDQDGSSFIGDTLSFAFNGMVRKRDGKMVLDVYQRIPV